MSNDRSRAAFLRFMDYLGEKGLMKPATAAVRKASASKLLEILPADEAQDVTVLDLDLLMSRFNNLHGQKYTPGSLATYQSRLKSSLEDFESYLANPLAFRPATQTRERRPNRIEKVGGGNSKTEEASPAVESNSPGASRNSAAYASANLIMPIQLRPDLTVHIQGLPFDLTPSEARKLANVILALATTSD